MLIRFKLGKDKYEIDEDDLTIGESAFLKREYDLTKFEDIGHDDPEILLGLLAVALKRKDPELSGGDARTQAEGIKSAPIFEDITKQYQKIIEDAEARAAEDPPSPAVNASTAGATGGKPATTRKTRGARS